MTKYTKRAQYRNRCLTVSGCPCGWGIASSNNEKKYEMLLKLHKKVCDVSDNMDDVRMDSREMHPSLHRAQIQARRSIINQSNYIPDAKEALNFADI